jgi:hypothetical protein
MLTDRALLQRIRTLLSRNVREEMNLLYTEPVQETPRGCDFGLFCREHAYTTYLLGRMNGLPVELALGHYFVRAPSGSVNVTLDTGADHAWCSVGSVAPVDLSMTFRYAADFQEIDRPIVGEGTYDPYTVTLVGESDFRCQVAEQQAGERSDIAILYWEVERIGTPTAELVERPHDFLLSPAFQGEPTLTESFGSDFFAKVATHMDEVAHGRGERLLHGPADQLEAMHRIAGGYADALVQLQARLG